MSASAVLEVNGLSKHFGQVQALRDVSFTVEPGEVFGYLGPNGAGKTTTLRIALGLVHPTSGQAKLLGQNAADANCRTRVGFLPGDLHLYGDLTGRQLLDHFARFRPHAPPSLRPELVSRLSLDASALHRRVKFLSHGTRQKLGLIIAMQHDPALLILDEPSNGLDPLVQQSFRELVADLAARGRAVLFSSHMLKEAQDVCSRVAIVRQGELVALESVDRLRSNVVRRITIRFADAVPANLLDLPAVARSEVRDGQVSLWIRGDLNPLLRELAKVDVVELVFPEPELEDIFLSYYQPVEARP